MSRSAMSIRGKRAASAESRATLPALCPWRTIHNCCGHFCSTKTLKEKAVLKASRVPGELAMGPIASPETAESDP